MLTYFLAIVPMGWGYVARFLAPLLLLDTCAPGGEGALLALGLRVARSDMARL